MTYGRAVHLFFRPCFRSWLLCFTSEHGFEIGLDSVVLGVAVDGRMNGIAYVELPDAATADAAKEKLHRKYLGRRFVEVRLRNDARHSRHIVTDRLHCTYVLSCRIIFWFRLRRFRQLGLTAVHSLRGCFGTFRYIRQLERKCIGQSGLGGSYHLTWVWVWVPCACSVQ